MFVTTPRSAGAERMQESDDGQERGIRIKGWEIKSKHSGIATQEVILNYEEQLVTKHLPELLFSEAGIDIKHVASQVMAKTSSLSTSLARFPLRTFSLMPVAFGVCDFN